MKLPTKRIDILDSIDFRDILDPDIRHPIVSGGVFHTCTNCKREFIPTRYWNHFCSDECRVTSHSRKKVSR
jgi:hypothetical protein